MGEGKLSRVFTPTFYLSLLVKAALSLLVADASLRSTPVSQLVSPTYLQLGHRGASASHQSWIGLLVFVLGLDKFNEITNK